MIEGARKMMCGGCGGEDFEIYSGPKTETGLDIHGDLYAECKGCDSVTKISVLVGIQLSWVGDSEGTLCVK